jgi:5-hydroxyisourate hydrolase
VISTHVLDTARGRPAAGVPVALELVADAASGEARELARATTDDEGRVRALLPTSVALVAGEYRLTFDTRAYYAAQGVEAFYPVVSVVFTVRNASQHHHVPLLLSPYGYATYRGT